MDLEKHIVEIKGVKYIPYNEAVKAIMESVSVEIKDVLAEFKNDIDSINKEVENND